MQIRKAIRAIMSDHEDGLKDLESLEKVKSSEKTDALEVTLNHLRLFLYFQTFFLKVLLVGNR